MKDYNIKITFKSHCSEEDLKDDEATLTDGSYKERIEYALSELEKNNAGFRKLPGTNQTQ